MALITCLSKSVYLIRLAYSCACVCVASFELKCYWVSGVTKPIGGFIVNNPDDTLETIL